MLILISPDVDFIKEMSTHLLKVRSMLDKTSVKESNSPLLLDTGCNGSVFLDNLKQFAIVTPYGFVITECEKKNSPIIFVNPAFENITGYNSSEALGRNCCFLLGKDRKQKALGQFRDALKNRQQCTAVMRNYRKNKSRFYNELSMVPFCSGTGKVTYCIWMQRDITDQVKKEEQMARLIKEKDKRFSAYMENANEAIWRIDFEPAISLDNSVSQQVQEVFAKGFFTEANDVVAQIYGLREGREVVGKPLNNFMSDSVNENVRTVTDFVRNKFHKQNVITNEETGDGTTKTILNNISPFIQERKVYFIWGSSLDVTELFKAQNNLKLSRKRLKEQKRKLEEKNIALRELIVQIGLEKREFEDRVIANIAQIILPSLEKIRLKQNEEVHIEQIRNDLNNITSYFGKRLVEIRGNLSPREVEVCNLVKNGMSNKEIARLLNIAVHTVEKHRRMARNKLGLVNEGINLRSYLQSL